MELTKYSSTEILAHIKHDLRQLPEGKNYGNESIDSNLSVNNYSLLDRVDKNTTAAEVNKYRKDFEKKIFKYHRKNLVHAVELVIQCPSDCPPEQHDAFFQAAFDWYCENYLPAGKDCVFLAEVHKDEHKFVETENGLVDISKEHLHLAYVPAIPAGEKHPDFEYRLNADSLTKKSILNKLHPSFQAYLNEKEITATVYKKKEGDGKTFALSVSQLKTLTKEFGITLDKSLTVEKLAELIKSHEFSKEIGTYQASISEKDRLISDLKQQLSKFHEMDQQKVAAVSPEHLRQKDAEIEKLTAKVQDLEKSNSRLQEALQKEISRNQELQKSYTETIPAKEWGISEGWGQTKTIEEDKIW